MGAHVIGSDLNINVLRGTSGGRNVASNFEQYKLSLPVGIPRADVLHSPFQNKRPWLDAIVCDPPYGIKEGTRSSRRDVLPPPTTRAEPHIVGTERVRLTDFLDGLLEFAARNLVPGGRLVYWLPTTTDYREEDVPRHGSLRNIANSEQVMTMRMSRRLITMQRLSEAEEAEAAKETALLTGSNELGPARLPAHFDLAAKVLRQSARSDTKLRPRQSKDL
jgi:tRNA (guanine10-N2)-methyltransferase